jgi:hypothetical protein
MTIPREHSPKFVLVLLQYLQGLVRDGPDRAAAHLDGEVLVVGIVAIPRDLADKPNGK